MDRRKFFKIGAGGTLLLFGAGSLRWIAGGYSSQLKSEETPICLSAKEFIIARSILETLLPEEEGFPSGVSLGLAQRLDEEIWALSPRLQSDLKNGLQVLEHGTLFQGHMSRFSSLSIQDRRDCYEGYLTGSNDLLQQIASGLKVMVHFFYYTMPQVWPKIGYEGPFVQGAMPAPSRAAYAELLTQRRSGKTV